MITKIGTISGRILDLLKKNNGLFVFGEIQSSLNQPHDFILMSLGWLVREGHVRILEDPLRVSHRHNGAGQGYRNDAFMYDLIVDSRFDEAGRSRAKNLAQNIRAVAGKVLTLVEGCEDVLALQTLERSLHESRAIILMSIGWLIGEEYVRGINSANDIFIFQVSKENDNPIDRVMKAVNLICV
jgi:hypothetical protein